MQVRNLLQGTVASLLAVVLSLGLASVILLIDGSNPLTAYMDMFDYGTNLDVTVSMLNRAIPLFFSALAVAIGFRMNLFNIGVEGQYVLAALVAAEVAGELSFPAPFHLFVVIIVAMAVGSAWAAIPGILRVTHGIHEVISTIMFNFIGINFLVAHLLTRWKQKDDPFQLTTETDVIPESGRFPELNNILEWFTRDLERQTSLNGFFVVAIIVGLLYWIYTVYTRPGYDLRISGMNPLAAQAAGVPPGRTIIVTMLLSGAIAGLVGMPQILGVEYGYTDEFIRMLGFGGITVALLGQNHPGGIAISAIFISYLDTTAPILDITDAAPPEIITIMKGIIIFVMVIVFEYTRRMRKADEAKRSSALLLQQSDPKQNGFKQNGAEKSKPEDPKIPNPETGK